MAGPGAFGEEQELAAAVEGSGGIAHQTRGAAVRDVAGEARTAAEEGIAKDAVLHDADWLWQAGYHENRVPQRGVVGSDDDRIVALAQRLEGIEVGMDQAGDAQVADENPEGTVQQASAEALGPALGKQQAEGQRDDGE